MTLNLESDILSEEELKLLSNSIPLIAPLIDTDENDINDMLTDPISYVNHIFPDEESLSTIDDVIKVMNEKIDYFKEEIENELVDQCSNSDLCSDYLSSTSITLKSLFEKITILGKQARSSEQVVREVTVDIKHLENAKKNLSNSITALNHLQILSSGVIKLRELTKEDNYYEINQIIGGLIMIEDIFKTYEPIPQIITILDELQAMKHQLSTKLKIDFNSSCSSVFKDMTTIDAKLMNNISCISENIFAPLHLELIDIFINYSMEVYKSDILCNPENAWLDRLDRRFSLIKRILISYDEVYNLWFPYSWSVDEKLVHVFCTLTRESLEQIIEGRKSELDVKLLLSSIQKTILFEEFLNDRFSTNDISSNPFTTTGDQSSLTPNFNGIISVVFDKYFYVYSDVQEGNLLNLINKFVSNMKPPGNLIGLLHSSTKDSSSLEGSNVLKLTTNTSEIASTSISLVLPCAGELFMYYKKCLMQFSKMRALSSVVILIGVFKKYLKEFNTKILEMGIPQQTSSSRTIVNKDVDKPIFKEDIKTWCCVIVTSEYCIDTIMQLEQKIREIVQNTNNQQLSFNEIIKLYDSNLQNGLDYLKTVVTNLCEPGINIMLKTSWSNYDCFGDQSYYITLMASSLQQIFPLIREYLNTSKKCYDAFCISFIHNFIPTYIASVYKCKPITTIGIEQLLLDTQLLKHFILTLPNIGSTLIAKIDTVYTDYVKDSFKKLEIMLKLVITPHKPYNEFVEKYLNLINDGDVDRFQKVLEMKCLKKTEQTLLIENFQVLVNSKKIPI